MADKFRTILSLLGVCAGIFAIVAVFTLVDSIQSTINESFENYGSDILFVERQPLEPDLNEDGFFRWWEYLSRPPVRWSEYRFLEENYHGHGRMAFTAQAGSDAVGVDGEWRTVIQEPLSGGRLFSRRELEEGSSVAILGGRTAEKLFPEGGSPIGKSVRLFGSTFRIIGTLAQSGDNAVRTVPADEAVIVPVRALARVTDISTGKTSIAISSADECRVRLLMRQARRMRPRDKDNFALNRLSFIVEQTAEIFDMVNTLGWIVGVFSLLVGGFGIANILFVNVEERTWQIGVQKALGARRLTIVSQYLKEAALLSLGGGAVGVLLVLAATLLIPSSVITLRLSPANAATGLAVSFFIGILAGVAPAVKAARLDPVEAIGKQ